jgi:hypothetical protein
VNGTREGEWEIKIDREISKETDGDSKFGGIINAQQSGKNLAEL